MDLISTETGITVGLAITLIGGVVWLTKLHGLASSTANTIRHIEKRQDAADVSAVSMQNDISVINTKLDYILEELKRQHK